MLTDGLEWCGSLVDYCDVFISCLDSHSDGTHSLQRIYCWASDAMLHFSKSVSMQKQINLHLGWMIPLTKPMIWFPVDFNDLPNMSGNHAHVHSNVEMICCRVSSFENAFQEWSHDLRGPSGGTETHRGSFQNERW